MTAAILVASIVYIVTRSVYTSILVPASMCVILIFLIAVSSTVTSIASRHNKGFYEDWEDSLRVKPFAKLWTPPIPGVKRRKQKRKY